MDEELKSYLTAMEARLNQRIDGVVQATAAEIGALHTEIRQVEARLTAKIDASNNRLDRHAALLQSGARQLMRIFQNEEELSELWRTLDKRMDALERKLGDGSQAQRLRLDPFAARQHHQSHSDQDHQREANADEDPPSQHTASLAKLP